MPTTSPPIRPCRVFVGRRSIARRIDMKGRNVHAAAARMEFIDRTLGPRDLFGLLTSKSVCERSRPRASRRPPAGAELDRPRVADVPQGRSGRSASSRSYELRAPIDLIGRAGGSTGTYRAARRPGPGCWAPSAQETQGHRLRRRTGWPTQRDRQHGGARDRRRTCREIGHHRRAPRQTGSRGDRIARRRHRRFLQRRNGCASRQHGFRERFRDLLHVGAAVERRVLSHLAGQASRASPFIRRGGIGSWPPCARQTVRDRRAAHASRARPTASPIVDTNDLRRAA